ncbi:MAG: VanZ family protein [Methylomonas sp.]|nr:VanZ family protein [Methylomonas sp.]PPD22617.1 MAG: hypothetical protein CTY23_01685 [Methylomonas sp.]PPD27928.1 MAG: hypothetical protein CTY22_00565 [Methylomonas sp.]PPD40038.1 MAG: hypothetical protein CTY21_00565 [Methylomonas sp.]PPD41574.1 MAG: hypothetical protein CTY17_03585 [Methylomonas sp.]
MMTNRLFVAFCYWLFVVYGSLVPLEYRHVPFEQAVEQFSNIRFLNLGIASRADWIANILLYIPLSALLLAAFEPRRANAAVKGIIALAVVVLCLSTAAVVEFVQQYFPPRTVSINDLIAETLGTLLGVAAWFSVGGKVRGYWWQLASGNWLSVNAAIAIYLPIYITLSLFPFDFVTSYAELETKWHTANDTLWFDVSGCQENALKCAVKPLVEVAVMLPLGMLFGALRFAPNRVGLAIVTGFLLGLFIEVVQIFIYSANAQGFSVLTRIAGMAMGVRAYDYVMRFDFAAQIGRLRVLAMPVAVVYLLLWLSINGWFQTDWLPWSAAGQNLAETQFLPFYYFYYTTETVAFVSLLSNIGGYLPIGALFWLFNADKPAASQVSSVWVGSSAAMLAVVVETGKLFLADKHADPTDILIAYCSATLAYHSLNALQNLMRRGAAIAKTGLPPPAPIERLRPEFRQPLPPPSGPGNQHPVRWLIGIALGLTVFYGVLTYPVLPVLLGLGLIAYAYAFYRQRWMGVLVLPALLPVMDFAPWTGRFFFDEFDLLLLTTLALAVLLPLPVIAQRKRHDIRDMLIIACFFLVLTISLMIGLLPMADFDHNAFSNYYSNFNALRVAKGFIAALLLAPYFVRAFSDDLGRRYFTAGMVLGLMGTGMFAVIERAVFPGIWDFATNYRINALFATMHTGGGHIESYLMLAMPLLAIGFVNESSGKLLKIVSLMAFALSLYALLVSFSRGGAIGFAVALPVLLAGLWWHGRARRMRSTRSLVWLVLIVATTAFLALPVFKGELMQTRIDVTERDQDSRQHHWQTAIDMMDHGIITQVFGMGLGSFPRTFFWGNRENAHPASYRFGSEHSDRDGDTYLALRGGDALFFGQYIALLPHHTYRLAMRVRSPDSATGLAVPICEKSLQYSFHCVTVDIDVAAGAWQSVERIFDSGSLGAASPDIAAGFLTRPVQMALYNGNGPGKVVEIDDIRLTAVDAPDVSLIANGDFSAGMDHWYFSTEKHNPWHVFNVWVYVLFEMGWLGLLVFVSLLAYVYYRLVKALKHDVYAPVLLASFTGFLVVGFVDSPFDAPRLSFLFLLLSLFALFGCKRTTLIFNNKNQ